jgi:ATP-dependent Clp protease adaptor protein ClpS
MGTVTSPETVVLEQPSTDEVVSEDRPWIVIVWNDPINLMSYVTFVLQKLFGYSLEKATELMLDVHHKGKAVVASDTRERSEMHVFRLHEHGLWATLEHDEGGRPPWLRRARSRGGATATCCASPHRSGR